MIMKLWEHILLLLYQYNGAVSVPELARQFDWEVERGRVRHNLDNFHSLDTLTESVRYAVEVGRKQGYIKREVVPQLRFGRGRFGENKGTTPKYLYSISDRGVALLRWKRII